MRSTLCLSALLALATAGVASASVISFNPTGTGTAVPAASFDFLPGNLLSIPDGIGAASLFYQARLGAVLDSAGHPIPLPGLNGPAGDPNSYEITAVFGVDVGVFPSGPDGGTLQFASLGTPSPTSYFSLYFDHAANASDLAGTGFRDGTPILTGGVGLAIGAITSIPSITGPSGSAFPLDEFNPANYPGVVADLATGSLKIASEADAVDPAFFPDGANFGLLTDTTLATPYFHTDPSGNFDIGLDGSVSSHIPNIGPVDGEGPESVLESDGATGFLPVPEPASLSLLAVGATTLLASRRRRRA